MKNRAVLLAASVLFLAVPAFAQRPEDRRPNEQRGEENTMSTDRMRLAPIKGASPIPPSAANHAPPLPSRTARKAGASTPCRM